VTRMASARVAGAAYLLYIALAFPAMVLFERAASGQGIAARLARIAQHPGDVRLAAVLTLLTCFVALALAVALYGITRDEDRDVALLALTCRAGEGVLNAIAVVPHMGLLWLATGGVGTDAPAADAAYTLAAFLLQMRAWCAIAGATLFAVGSTLFCWLLLRGRAIPAPLAWLGVLASALLVALLPAQLAGVARAPLTDLMWLPIAVFEIVAAVWLLVRGVPAPAGR
jgi:hypothetical protein